VRECVRDVPVRSSRKRRLMYVHVVSPTSDQGERVLDRSVLQTIFPFIKHTGARYKLFRDAVFFCASDMAPSLFSFLSLV